MGRLIDGIMGPFRGKVGPIVGYTRNGQGIIRSLPKKISKKPSQKQLDNRKKMAACQEWLGYITAICAYRFQKLFNKAAWVWERIILSQTERHDRRFYS